MDIGLAAAATLTGLVSGSCIPLLARKIMTYKYHGTEQPPRVLHSTKARYILMLINLAGFLFIFQYTEKLFPAVLLALIWLTGIVISVIDMEVKKIPNELVLITAALGGLFQYSYFGGSGTVKALFSMILIMAVFSAVAGLMGFNTVGAGDVKLAGAMALVLGYPYVLPGLVAMGVLIAIYSGIGIALKKMTMKSMLTFAPFMMGGMAAAIILLLINQ